MRYDLHLHTCLSPCADRDMTPATVAGLAKLAGAELIAVTDHNSALNLPAAEKACREYGLRLLPGLEVTTAEELHLLCYFKTVEAALEYGRELYAALPALPCDPVIWGEQWVTDEEDRVLDKVDKLLTAACAWPLEEAAARCRALGGEPVPAHADAESYSVLPCWACCRRKQAFRRWNCAGRSWPPSMSGEVCCRRGWRCSPPPTPTSFRRWGRGWATLRPAACCAACFEQQKSVPLGPKPGGTLCLCMLLQKGNARIFTGFAGGGIPDAHLHLAHMHLSSSSMHSRLWPMPPPMVRGSWPASSILWKARFRRPSQPARVS